MLVFVDTNIFLDYLLERKNLKGEDIGNPAFAFFSRTLHCEFEIAISTLILQELYTHFPDEKTVVLIEMLKPKLRILQVPEALLIEAKMYGPNYHDKLHALLAQQSGAEFIITRNVKDFQASPVKPKLPEDV